MKIVLEEGDQANGVASIVGTLLQQNFENFQGRDRIADRVRRPVAIYNVDTKEGCTLTFGPGETRVANEVIGKPVVEVRATTNQIVDVSQLLMRGGGLLPAGFFTRRGLRVLGQIATGRLKVRGLLSHPLTALRLIALVSVVDGSATSRERSREMKRARVALLVSLIIGVVLVAAPLILNVAGKTAAVDRLTDDFRPALTADAVVVTRERLETVKAMAGQLQTEVIPALAQPLGLASPEAVAAFLGENFPAVGKGMSELGTILPAFDGLVSAMEGNVKDFHLSDCIPTCSLPTTTVTWLFILPGVVLVLVSGLGLAGLKRESV